MLVVDCFVDFPVVRDDIVIYVVVYKWDIGEKWFFSMTEPIALLKYEQIRENLYYFVYSSTPTQY